MPRFSLPALVVLALACALPCLAQDGGYWRASSSSASRITGDIVLSGKSLTIDFTGFPLTPLRTLKPAEVASVFDADINASPTGTLYRLRVPANRRFLHHNTLCGTEDTEWMATFVSGKSLQAAFFSGDTPPVFTMDAITNSATLCGTFTYAR